MVERSTFRRGRRRRGVLFAGHAAECGWAVKCLDKCLKGQLEKSGFYSPLAVGDSEIWRGSYQLM
jgi:hypothetical protein